MLFGFCFLIDKRIINFLGSYETLRKKGFMQDAQGKIIFWESVLIGGIVGVAGAWTASPFYLIKTQIQSQAAQDIAFGHQHKHKGMFSGLATIYKTNGIKKGIYRGAFSALPRAFVGSTSQLTSFSLAKEWLTELGLFPNSPLIKTFAASMVGGIFVGINMTPFDLVSTRLYNQGR